MSIATPPSVRIERLTAEAWDALLDQFSDANLYQTWAYGSTCWAASQLEHAVVRLAGAPVALTQVRVVKVPLIGSGIAYVRWGPVCVRQGERWSPEHWRACVDELVAEYVRRRGLCLRLLPGVFDCESHASEIVSILADLDFREDPTERRYHSFRVDLSNDLHQLRQNLSSRWRRQLSIAGRNRLEIRESRESTLYEQFQLLYAEMMARKQFDTTVNVDQFSRIQRRLPDQQRMLTFICYSDGTPVAGLVVSMVGDTSIYLLAATGDAGLDARGSYALQWHAIERLKALGKRWYDLGGANESANPGVFTFKQGMGGVAVRQLGRFEVGGTALSRVSVAMGERVRHLLRDTRSKASPASANRE